MARGREPVRAGRDAGDPAPGRRGARPVGLRPESLVQHLAGAAGEPAERGVVHRSRARSEEHTSELQSLMRISYAVFCLKQKKHNDKKLTTQARSESSTTEHISI